MSNGTHFDPFDHMDDVESHLRGASDDLSQHVPSRPPGQFKPSPRPSMTAVAGLAVALLAGGAVWGLANRPQGQPIEVTAADETSVDETVSEELASDEVESGGDGDSGADGRPTLAPLTETNLGFDPVMQPEMANPGIGRFTIDPAFGSTIVRLSDVEPGEALVPIASTPSSWNVDETFLLLYRTGGERIGHELYRFDDAGRIELQAELELKAPDIEQVYRSRVDPEVLFHVDGNSLMAYNVTDRSSTTLVSFEGCESVDSGRAPIPQSANDNRWGLLCRNADQTELLAYNHQTGSLHRRPVDGDIVQAPRPVNTGGGYLVETADGVDLVDAELNLVRTVPNLEPENVGSVYELDGQEFAVGPVYRSEFVGSAVAVSLSDADAAPTVIAGPESGYPYPPAGTNRGGTGQVDNQALALAIHGTGGDGEETVLAGEVVAVDMATSAVARLAHHRATADSAFSRPITSISPSGRFIIFASDWGGDATNTYLVYRPEAS